MKQTINHETPSGTVSYGAFLYFDDGDYPNAEVEEHGYYDNEDEAREAMSKALAAKPADVPSEVEPGNMAGWSGAVEKGMWVKDPDDEWFMQPSWERDESFDGAVEYRG